MLSPSNDTSRKKHNNNKGDVIETLTPWKVVPLFLKLRVDYVLPELPRFVAAHHHPLASLEPPPQLAPALTLPGVRRILNRADATTIWSVYTVVTAITLVLLGVTSDEIVEKTNHSNDNDDEDDEDDDDDTELCLEAWTWVQTRVNWKDFQYICSYARHALCIVSAPHPLEVYAAQVVPLLSRDEVMAAVQTLGWQAKFSTTSASNNTASTMAMRLSQLLKDSNPPRTYGILFGRRTPATEHEALLRHACLPNAALELKSPTDVSCIALYNDFDDSSDAITICSVPLDGGAVMEREARRRCRRRPINKGSNPSDSDEIVPCILCRRHEEEEKKKTMSSSANSSNILHGCKDAVRLGHYYFQQERYRDATDCYQKALQQDETLDDIRHALGALHLAQGNFLQAQLAWKEAATNMLALGRTPENHHGINLQLKKLQAYHYLQETSEKKMATTASAKYTYQSYFNNQCFVTPMLDKRTCQKLIEMAISNGTWTTGRHYAVPTNDIPLHKVPELLDWFYPWMEQELAPLMKEQFATDHPTSVSSNPQQRFYIHDAFFVRYKGDGKTNHLPCHLDECTHSLVIGLNDNFEGGGTYFHDHDTVLSPNVGEVVTFKGDSLKHGGDAVTKGTRYILAVFLYLDKGYSTTSEQLVFSPKDTKKVQSMFHEPKKQKTGFSFGFQLQDEYP